MNCLIYLRVSTKEQAQTNESEGYSIAAQRKACAKYVQEKGWTLVDEYTDRGESARSAHNAVVVHKIDRLARNLKDHVEITVTLQKAKVGLVSVVENIEDTASGKRSFQSLCHRGFLS